MNDGDEDEPIDIFYRSEQTTVEEKREIFSQLTNKERFITEKTVLCSMSANIHEEFRIFAFKKRIAMNLILKGLIDKIVVGDQRLIEVVDEIQAERKQSKSKKLSKFDADSIYDLINKK